MVTIGNLRELKTYVPGQDKNKPFDGKTLKELCTLETLPKFSHEQLVKRSAFVDVIWFNQRLMPNSFFEIEHTTDIQNSLLKFYDLQDFYARMFIIADKNRRLEFEQKINLGALTEIKKRVEFVDYESLGKQYENELERASQRFTI